jgi:hypothetical protein
VLDGQEASEPFPEAFIADPLLATFLLTGTLRRGPQPATKRPATRYL